MINPLDMSGRTVLVTGASAGLGRETAILLSQLGARLILVARDRARLEETASRLAGQGHVVHPYDLNQVGEIPDWVQRIAVEFGRIHGLAYFAGISSPQPMRTWRAEVHDQLVRIHLTAALALIKGVRSHKVRGPSLSVVLLSSISGLRAASAIVDYSACKGAIIAATRSLALELARDDIRVNCVAPGLIQDTGMATTDPHLTEDQKSLYHSRSPLGPGKGSDVSQAVAFLLSEASRWITGICLPVDGGLSSF